VETDGPTPGSARCWTMSQRDRPCSGCTGATSGNGTTSNLIPRGVFWNTRNRCTARKFSQPAIASFYMAGLAVGLIGYWRSCTRQASESSTHGLSSETPCVRSRTFGVSIFTGPELQGSIRKVDGRGAVLINRPCIRSVLPDRDRAPVPGIGLPNPWRRGNLAAPVAGFIGTPMSFAWISEHIPLRHQNWFEMKANVSDLCIFSLGRRWRVQKSLRATHLCMATATAICTRMISRSDRVLRANVARRGGWTSGFVDRFLRIGTHRQTGLRGCSFG
jgi:hypothetical protein